MAKLVVINVYIRVITITNFKNLIKALISKFDTLFFYSNYLLTIIILLSYPFSIGYFKKSLCFIKINGCLINLTPIIINILKLSFFITY